MDKPNHTMSIIGNNDTQTKGDNMTMNQAYKTVSQSNSFIANALLTSISDKARVLKKIALLLNSGKEIQSASFVMPYVGFLVDGKYTTLDEIRGVQA